MQDSKEKQLHTLEWTFRNDHKWIKEFEYHHEAVDFMIRCGLVSHQDVVCVILDGEFYKGENHGS